MMKLYLEESRRYVIDHGRKGERAEVNEIAAALAKMPNGWLLSGIEHRTDGTAVVLLSAPKRKEVEE